MAGKSVQFRNFTPEIRAEGDEYVFEGYAVTWDSIDSYDTTFKRGAFKKTIDERGTRIKVLWNHNTDEPIGKIVEIREDDKGLFVRGKLTEGVSKADDVFKNLKAGVIDTLSFGFTPLQDRKVKGSSTKEYAEVKLYEVSPVTFEANATAVITDVREAAQKILDQVKTDKEKRDQDFNESLENEKAYQGGWTTMEALYITLSDIWWESNEDEVVSKIDVALSQFHAAYLTWAKDYISRFWETRKMAMAKNDLSRAFINAETRSVEVISQETSFTAAELKTLSSGDILPKESRNKLVELPEEIRSAHQKMRSKAVETLCDELRVGGFNEAEKMRFNALLGLEEKKETPSVISPVDQLANIRKTLNK